jgi:sensor histidine kinase YesM
MMRLFVKNGLTWQLQVIIWLIIFALSLIANLQYDPFSESLSDAVMLVVFYPVIIYVNAYVLLPRLYYRGKASTYFLAVIVLLAVTIVTKVITVNFLYNTFFTSRPQHLTINLFIYTSFSFSVIYLFSIIFRLAIDYFALSARHAAIKVERVQTELSMLKHQVQPHFLFNTLNNIYYEVQKDSPESAGLIVRLSGIIRYFMDESQKEKVFLKDEIALLQSYIELENIRMRFNFSIDFHIDGNVEEILIPPLLLLPITENIYKHGIDKRQPGNTAYISLIVTERQLFFSTRNKVYDTPPPTSRSGIANLRKRLSLYYGDHYELNLAVDGDAFHVNLIIPLSYDPLHIN